MEKFINIKCGICGKEFSRRLKQFKRQSKSSGPKYTPLCGNALVTQQELNDRMSYVKDNRTNICFAVVSSWTKDAYIVRTIATVPCSDEVTKLIEVKKQ